MYKILLLTDFSAASRHAIRFAQALFDDIATEFCLLNAFPVEPEVGFSGAFLLAEQRQLAEQEMAHLEHAIRQQPVPAYHTYRSLVMVGSPVSAVKTLLGEEVFDLVVVGAVGTGHSELFGSVATDMIRSVTTNVLVVPASAPIRPINQVVLATDYRSVKDTGTFALLTDLASRKAARLTLLTIENPKEPGSHAAELSRHYVLNAFDTIQVDTYTIHDDDVLHGINAYLDLHPVDLFVMVPHHKGFFDLLRNASLTRPLAYRPRVPLLTLFDEKAAPAPPTPSAGVNNTPYPTYN
ncbi:universal stress protein [Spirosoma rigui]|uniref:universal stress protein n=1 Tax=Spirosoma rigui TaxID=564064 RepID=UPI0009AFCF10|nr:universal stress protein [Spirosoma rigui]